MKILITGGAGFIGSNFIRHFLKARPAAKVLNYDALTYSGNLDNLRDVEKNKNYKFTRGNILNKRFLEAVVRKFKPDYLINFAAETHVDKSIHQKTEDFAETNFKGVFNILETVRGIKIKKILQVSTDEVYGSLNFDSNEKFNENNSISPNSPYAATKAAADMLCRAYHHTFKLPIVITRSSNNYGPYQYPEKLIPFFISRVLQGKKLPLYGDGKNVRDWIYVADNCRALEKCLFDGDPGEVYNIGANEEISNLEITTLLLDHFGKGKELIEFVPDRPGHDRRYAIDSRKLRSKLGWKPLHQFKPAFKETVNWYLNNQNWIKSLLKKKERLNPHID